MQTPLWTSKGCSVEVQEDYRQVHTHVFEEAREATKSAFHCLLKSLLELESDIIYKINEIETNQFAILRTSAPSKDAIEDMASNIKKISRSLDAFSAHAGNLSHVKLTLARAASIVSSEGLLMNLVTKTPQDPYKLLFEAKLQEQEQDAPFQRSRQMPHDYSQQTECQLDCLERHLFHVQVRFFFCFVFQSFLSLSFFRRFKSSRRSWIKIR